MAHRRRSPPLFLLLAVGCGTAAPDTAAPMATVVLDCIDAPPLAIQRCFADADPQQPPATLSEARCFSNLESLTPGDDLVPYEVASPLFSDGSDKGRWLVLPPNTTMTVDAEGRLQFPTGSALLKQFDVPREDSLRRVETRVMLRTDTTWALFTYIWREDGSDADLSTEGATLSIVTDEGPLGWLVPTASECGYCHGAVPEVLGPVQIQLDRDICVGARVVNQLDAFEQWGLLQPGFDRETPLVDPQNASLSLDDRARSYLHTNCAHCHRPGGWTSPGMNMYWDYRLPLADTHSCDEPVQFLGQLGVDFRVLPGEPESSHVFTRMRGDGIGKMPAFGERTDPAGLALIREWIANMEGCAQPD